MQENNNWRKLHFSLNNNNIADFSSQNKNEIIPFQYLLSGIDKLHDFGEYFTAIYNLIYEHHFLYNYPNKNAQLYGKKIIGTQELVESDLKNKVGSLHKIIDFSSYKKDTPPILGAPNLIFRSSEIGKDPYFDFNSKAPFGLSPVKLKDLNVAEYLLQVPPERDVIMYLRGKKQEFIANASKIQQLLDITNPEYVSKDAFPLPQEIIDGMFNRPTNSPFISYTSEIMDPATQSKQIVSGNNKLIETLFCVLPNNNRLFIKVQSSNPLKLTFSLQKSNGQSIQGTNEFKLTNKILTPSIQDVVIYLFMEEYNQLTISDSKRETALKKSYGAKILNAFKKNKKSQQQLANKLKNEYFNPLFNAIPNEAKNNLAQKQLISVATKTIGDQTYLWDSLIHDSINGVQNPFGSFVVTVDSFLFDQIVHGKNANAVFASKSNAGLIRDTLLGSTYQMAIYLKPLSAEAAEKFKKDQANLINTLQQTFNNEITKLNENKNKIVNLMTNLKDKRSTIISLLVSMFQKFKPQGRRIPSHYTYNGNKIESFNISNYYYNACYLLQFIIQCEISLSEVGLYNVPQSLPNDISVLRKEVAVIKSMNGKFSDAETYYTNPLTTIIDESTLYEYLNQGEAVPGVKSDLGLIEPVVGSAPDFESVRNSLNINKNRLDVNLPRGSKLPSTIGFSKGYFLIKDTISRFFQDYDINVNTVTGGAKRGREDESDPNSMDIDNEEESNKKIKTTIIPEDEETILDKIREVFPQTNQEFAKELGNNSDTMNEYQVSQGIFIRPLDYYELLFILKQLFYLDNDFESSDTLGIQTGGKGKTIDDFYITVYELSVETGLWEYMRDFIEPERIVQKRKREANKAKQQGIDASQLSKLGNLRTGFNPGSAPVPPVATPVQPAAIPATLGGKKKTRRKQKKSKSKKSKKLNKTKKNKTKKKK